MRKNIFALLAALAVVGLVASFPVAAGEEGPVVSTFEVGGMTCGGCSAKIRLSVKNLEGVDDVEVSHDDNKATVTYDSGKLSADEIVKVIEKQGFTAKLEKTEKA